ncbi:MAG: Rrf2 family transcriptional regulator [Mariprofundaceae bacterium]|nr:Rrf2 family transcriptional regulator [Mariprofundaceae bacterium]
MQLTLYTDYSLRVLLYLASHPDKRVTINEIAEYFGISRNHLVKVVHNLGKLELIHTIRGKSGGLLLAVAPENINIADTVRYTEPHMNLLECFDDVTNTCPITSQCALKGVLFQARKGFMDVLENYTLADMLPKPAIVYPEIMNKMEHKS